MQIELWFQGAEGKGLVREEWKYIKMKDFSFLNLPLIKMEAWT